MNNQIAYVRSCGKCIPCEIIEIISSSYTLFQQVKVKAIKGGFASGLNIAIVTMDKIFFEKERNQSK